VGKLDNMNSIANLNLRDNYLRAARFSYPRFIPTLISIFRPVWSLYRERLKNIVVKHPIFFCGGSIEEYEHQYETSLIDRYKVDAFGCVWRTRIDGYIGEVIKHPLGSWGDLEDFKLPDPHIGVPTESGEPKTVVPWDEIFSNMERARERGLPVVAWLPHGFLFLRLLYLRGFRNLAIDMYKRIDKLYKLIDMLADYYIELVRIYRTGFSGIDVFYFGDDLGAEDRPLISPAQFKEFLYPAYIKLFNEVKAGGSLVRLHSDGRIVELWNLILGTGVDILNIQDRPNRIENIVKLKNRVCIDLDIDRRLLAFGSPSEVEDYLRNVINVFRDPRGGFMIEREFHPPSKIETIECAIEMLQKIVRL